MKLKNLFLFGILTAFSYTVQAQDISQATESEKKSAERNVKTLTNKLLLSVKQSERMMERVTQYEMAKHAVYKSDADDVAKNKELIDLEQDHYEKTKDILTPTQYEKFMNSIAESKKGKS